MRRHWSLRTKLTALCVSLTTMILVSAICLRWIWAKPRRPAPHSDYSLCLVDAAGRILSQRTGVLRLVLDPFTVYRNAPNQRTGSYEIDENGFRGGLGARSGPRVFVLGGSAAFGQDLSSDKDTLTAQLSSRMGSVEFVNAGVVGYLSGQELALLVHYVDSHKPEGVIVFDGWNELFDQWLFGGRPISRLGFNNTFFEVEDRLHVQACASIPVEPTPRMAPSEADLQRIFEEALKSYLSNLEKMNAFARSRGAWFLVAPQPEIGDRCRLTQEETASLRPWNTAYGYTARGFSEAYRVFVDRALAFCSSQDIPAVAVGRDRGFADADTPLFLDPVHLSPAGARVAAGVMSDVIERVRADGGIEETAKRSCKKN